MAIRLRDAEKEEIAMLLERTYVGKTEAAATILRRVATLLAQRDSYAVVLRMAPMTVAWGPWYDLQAAKKVTGLDPEACHIIQLHSPAEMERRLEVPRDARYCPDCGHPKVAHVDRMWRPLRAKRLQEPQCMVVDCECKSV